jgi:cell division septation protein DedD
MTRGDRSGSRAHLELLQREHPTGATSTRASVLLARLAFDDGDVPAGCAAVNAARDGLTPADIELRNQVEYYAPRCANLAAATAARDSAALAAPATALGAAGRMVDSATSRSASRAAAAAAPSSGRQEYSVQVAAYETRADAEALSKRLSARGYTVRVVGDRKPFRVRVGRYPTRERAADAVRQMGRLNVHGVIVEAEPR